MRPHVRRLVFVVAAGLLAGLSAVPAVRGEDNRVRLEVGVSGGENGEPIANAIVYAKFKEERFLRRDKRREWSLKTNSEGKAVFPELPGGQVLVQVVAKGWKTYGHYYTLQGPKQIVQIKLKRAKKWY